MAQPACGGHLIGYARVSTDDQDLSLQMDSLIGLGVSQDDIFTDKASGAKTERPGLDACLANLQQGDTLVVWRLDQLGRSMHHLVELIEELRNRGVGFRSVSDGLIDTTSPSGDLIFHIFSALAQCERRLIQERTKAGLAPARARGRLGGLGLAVLFAGVFGAWALYELVSAPRVVSVRFETNEGPVDFPLPGANRREVDEFVTELRRASGCW